MSKVTMHDTWKSDEEYKPHDIWRFLAFKIIKRIYNTKITPNQVSVTNWGFAALGSALVLTGNWYCYILAAVCFFMFVVFDCVDGGLARARKSVSLYGWWLESIGHFIYDIGPRLAVIWVIYTIAGPSTLWLAGSALITTGIFFQRGFGLQWVIVRPPVMKMKMHQRPREMRKKMIRVYRWSLFGVFGWEFSMWVLLFSCLLGNMMIAFLYFAIFTPLAAIRLLVSYTSALRMAGE